MVTVTRRRVAAILFFLIAGYGLAARDTISDARWIAILWLSWIPLLVAIWPEVPPTVPTLGRSALRMTMIFLSIMTLCTVQLLRVQVVMSDSLTHRVRRRDAANVVEVENEQLGRRFVAAVMRRFFVVAAAERDHVVRVDQRPEALELGHDRRPMPRDEREVRRRGLAVHVGIGLVVIGVSVDEEQPETAAAAQGDPVRVVATTTQAADLARNVGGDRVEVQSIMGPGVDPHLYRASESDLQTMFEADVCRVLMSIE